MDYLCSLVLAMLYLLAFGIFPLDEIIELSIFFSIIYDQNHKVDIYEQ